MSGTIFKNFLLFSAIFAAFAGAPLSADLTMELEAGNFQILDEFRPSPSEKPYFQALGELYRGNIHQADQTLSDVSTAAVPSAAWLKNYLSELRPVVSDLQKTESEHFVLWATPRDKIMAAYALDALEIAYQKIGGKLWVFPKEKVRVEIYPSQESFSVASTLSKETLERSGAIGICKFRRLMVMSPEQLPFGYRWLDTLTHEYVHYLINIASSGKCPLWLHEGIAKYLDTHWRQEEPAFLSPGNRTELVRALHDQKLISFSRMEPSMVYLDNHDEVRLAFSEVAHAVHYIRRLKGYEGLRSILKELAGGNSRSQAFQLVLGQSDKEFENKWKEFLKEENLAESPGAMPDQYSFDRKKDELEAFVSTNLRGHIRLGDRMNQMGHTEVALMQYDKALTQEPANPVVLTKSAKILLQSGQTNEAILRLKKSMDENPNYSTAFLIYCSEMIKKGNWKEALFAAQEANAVNPFNPAVHDKLVTIYRSLGNESSAQQELQILNQLQPGQ